jgi:hypothetical protein
MTKLPRNMALGLTAALLGALLFLPSVQACDTAALCGDPPVLDGCPGLDCPLPVLPCQFSFDVDSASMTCALPPAVKAILSSLGDPPTIEILGICAGIQYGGSIGIYEIDTERGSTLVRTLSPYPGDHGAFGNSAGSC